MEVTRGHQQFFANNLRFKWDRDVVLVSLRLSPQGASNDVSFDLLGSPSDLALTWPEVKFDLDLSRSNYTLFDAPWRGKHDGIKIVALPLKLKILSSKNRFRKFWNFDPWWPQFWPEPKNVKNDWFDFEMIFRELSIAVFRFVLRCAGAEIDGGCSNTPPSVGRKTRGPAGRGIMLRPAYVQFRRQWMGHRDKSYYRWRCMLTATPRTAISTKDAGFDGVWGQISLVFSLCFMFYLRLERNGTSKMGWDLENGTSNWDFKLGVKRSVNAQETRSSLYVPMRS